MAKRGRNPDLIQRRNQKLCERWYYWTEQKRLRFDDALKQLSQNEFFLSEERIMSILRECAGKEVGEKIKPVPKVRVPRISLEQLTLFAGEENNS